MRATTANTATNNEPSNLTNEELERITAGVGLGLRKSAGGSTTGTFFLTFVFKMVA